MTTLSDYKISGRRMRANPPYAWTNPGVPVSFAHLARVVKEGELRMHPQIGGLVEREMLEKIGASQSKGA
ncbi:hypothetical protein [Frigidibacter sp. SD6-1]|uniref:hypothetical protein n=1 Tax=Frigidibacter sp. SD6-1 TaxID=3032581 RepID=UPI0024DFCA4D|nr:hypothetical protein [Frigidibacter sp. SD6-1]